MFDLERLTEDSNKPPAIMVMGEFSAGKSTFINSVLGKKILDVSAVVATAVITKIVCGKKDQVVAHFRDGTKKEYGIKDFAELTSDKNKNNVEIRRKINYVEREYPSPFLNKFSFIDSPGLNAPTDMHEDTTQDFLANADAVIWIVDGNQAISAKEMKYLDELPSRLKPLVVVNKIDEFDEDEGDTPEEFLQGIRKKIKGRAREVIGISARQALDGKLNNDFEEIKESNIQEVLDKIENMILSESETCKVKSLLKKFGLYIHRLYESFGELENRIEPLKRNCPQDYEKFSSAISKVAHAVRLPAELITDYCRLTSLDGAEKNFFFGIFYSYILSDGYSKDAQQNFVKSAQENIVEAQMMLGNFEGAAKSGNPEAQFKLAELESNKGMLSQRGFALCQMSAEQNFADAQYLLAENLRSPQTKFALLKRAAENGHALAQFELAKMYYEGIGTVCDAKLAFHWYNRAAAQGIIDTFYFLAQCLLNGRGTEKNLERAFHFHLLAASFGNVAAIFEIAKAYFYGEGTEKNIVKAFVRFSEAKQRKSEQADSFLQKNYYNGSPETQFLLGHAYEFGEDLEQNLTEAVFWYLRQTLRICVKRNFILRIPGHFARRKQMSFKICNAK